MQSQLEEKILIAAIEEFGKKGLKFTMDDIARNLSISKKTMYQVFDNKEAMLLALADYCFTDIKKSERAIVEDPNLDVVDKIEQILVVLPEKYQNIGLSNLYQLSEKYPNIYSRVSAYLSTDWDATNALIEQGVAEGKIRPIALPVLQAMVESTIQKFFADSILVEHGISYEEALHEMIQIINLYIDGTLFKVNDRHPAAIHQNIMMGIFPMAEMTFFQRMLPKLFVCTTLQHPLHPFCFLQYLGKTAKISRLKFIFPGLFPEKAVNLLQLPVMAAQFIFRIRSDHPDVFLL